MTRHEDALGALAALLAASQAEPSPAAARPPRPAVSATASPPPRSDAVAPEAADLLARVLLCLPHAAATTQAVQILACGETPRAARVAGRLACAAAVLLGRTLLLNAHAATPVFTGDGAADAILPDAFMPGLYHRRIGILRPGELACCLRNGAPGTGQARPFRLIIVDSPRVGRGGLALAMAPLCAGALLVVEAGTTTRAQVRAAAAEMVAAGGRVLGTVLAGTIAGLGPGGAG